MKLALVYDRLNKVGGAEQVLTSISEIWPKSDWYTSLYVPENTSFAKKWNVQASFLNKLTFLKKRHEVIPFLMPFAFESFDFSKYDIVISVSSSEAKGIITKPETLHINYCLTPTRYLWSHRDDYINSNQFGIIQKLTKPIIRKLLNVLSKWDLVAATRPDKMITISKHVKNRTQKYYNRDTSIIYPPVDITKSGNTNYKPRETNYYLVVSRLVPYKRIDLLVHAFNKINKTLIIVGSGVELRKLKKIANKNIVFKGYLSDSEIAGYYNHCKAFLQANEEDFGIAMVEAQAAGKPVIAYNRGGATEIVTEESGILFPKQTISAIIDAVDSFELARIKPSKCRANAKRFARNKFKIDFKKEVEEAWSNYQQD